jgi:hypothetical protein
MSAYARVTGPGWRFFAGTMMVIAGFFNIIDGLVGITKSEYFKSDLLFRDIETWAWVILILGVVELVAGFAIFSASPLGSMIGIVVAGINAIGQLAWLRHYPEWSLVIIFIDILVIYALTVYGTQDRIDVSEGR